MSDNSSCQLFSGTPQSFKYLITNDHIEESYNHVHHATALRFLENARIDYLIAKGIPYHDYVASGLLIVIAKIDVTYHKELHKGSIEVVCKDPAVKKQFIFLKQQILIGGSDLAVSADVLSVFFDANSRKSLMPTQDFLEKFL